MQNQPGSSTRFAVSALTSSRVYLTHAQEACCKPSIDTLYDNLNERVRNSHTSHVRTAKFSEAQCIHMSLHIKGRGVHMHKHEVIGIIVSNMSAAAAWASFTIY